MWLAIMWLARTRDYIPVPMALIPELVLHTTVTRTGKQDVPENNVSPKKMKIHNKPHRYCVDFAKGKGGGFVEL